jgi:transposase
MKDWHLTPAQRGALEKRLAQTRDAGLFRRLLALLQVDQGQSIAQTARLVRVNRRSVHRWMQRFASGHGLSALQDHRGQGQPPHWSGELADWVAAALAQLPADWGYPANSWTVPLLQAFLAVYRPEQPVSASTLRRHLKASGYVWKRLRYVLAPDPEEEKKTPDFAANTGFARSHRAPGRRRNRPVALSASAFGLGAARTNRAGAHFRA